MRGNFLGSMIGPLAGRMIFGLLAIALVGGAGAEEPAPMPWKTNRPIAKVKKELYRKSPRPKTCAYAHVYYVGPGLERIEIQSSEARSDFFSELHWRLSKDNGRTWADSWTVPDNSVHHAGVEFYEGDGPMVYDPTADVLVEVWLRQVQRGSLFHNFTYYRLSRDFGKTWTAPKQLRYESGEQFDPEKPVSPGFLNHNEAYFGSNILVHGNGTLVHAVAPRQRAGRSEKRPATLADGLVVLRRQVEPDGKGLRLEGRPKSRDLARAFRRVD